MTTSETQEMNLHTRLEIHQTGSDDKLAKAQEGHT